MTKHLLRPSSGLQAVLCILRSLWFVPAAMHTPISLFLEQIVGARLYKDLWLNNQYKVIIFMKFIADLSKEIIPIAQQEPFLMVTRLHIPAWFLFLWHNSSPQIPHNLFFSCTLSESLPWLSFFFEKKKRKSESHIDWIFQWLSVYRDLHSSSSSYE